MGLQSLSEYRMDIARPECLHNSPGTVAINPVFNTVVGYLSVLRIVQHLFLCHIKDWKRQSSKLFNKSKSIIHIWG